MSERHCEFQKASTRYLSVGAFSGKLNVTVCKFVLAWLLSKTLFDKVVNGRGGLSF